MNCTYVWYHDRMPEMCYVSAKFTFSIFTLSVLDETSLVFIEKRKENKSFQQTRKLSTQQSCVCVQCACSFSSSKNLQWKTFTHLCCCKEKENDDLPSFHYNDESLPDFILWHENEDRMASKL